MQITTIGLDIAKNVFQVHGIDASEKVVVRKQLRRGQVGPQPERLHSEAGYMAAPERFAEPSNSFPLHRGRRPYMHRGRRPYMAHRVISRRRNISIAFGAKRTWADRQGQLDRSKLTPKRTSRAVGRQRRGARGGARGGLGNGKLSS